MEVVLNGNSTVVAVIKHVFSMGCNTSQEIPSYNPNAADGTVQKDELAELLEGDIEEGK